ncbi:RNA chaperone ProQ [Aliidiomarina maris]|uniref:RNA chaperone ProQ n=1 Tax=Aliidiomarina maris TaxID=531312 RepID=A0A327WZG5_9GAMM|nr:RNA chaperone ProQ [Aliidiomarina maris]RAJ98947.1 ProP effector [Aliidiomarina maris]RUO25090.1 RNA chaperone ProQ [Aliidiomarina maris]
MENQQNIEKLSTSKAVIAYLAEQFPACFSVEGEAKPLKIGIFDDLASRLADDPQVSKTRLRGALRQYTNSWRYLRCVTLGAHRVDLDGAEAGIVEEDHAQHAAETLAESKAKANEKRKLQAKDKPKQQDKAERPRRSNAKANASAKRNQAQRVGKSTATKAPKAEAKPELKLEQLSNSGVEVGQSVHVKLGQSPVAGTVTAVEKADIQVQLVSGITVKVKAENLYTEA